MAEALDRRLHIEGRQPDVLVQANTSGEASKPRRTPRYSCP
ncbi:alanine racemase [Stutzerimonas stutzeri ATCC 14405 = CCUG 16156]|nr:alanine racemase [Stutzerimonas stutzeri ATCC 14405 = CCUG 16156]